MRAITLLMLCGVLAGCATDASPQAALAMAPGQAGITISRSNGLLYMGVPASVDVNGERVTSLAVGQSYSGAVRPGPAVLTVSAWSSPGQSSYRFTVEPGKSYRFIVSPRTNNIVAGAAFGLIGQSAEGGGPFSVSPL
jgi:hypothetical protein